MALLRGERYSVDYDAEFEEMLTKLKSSQFHSSLIEESPVVEDNRFPHPPGLLVWSPSFSPIDVDTPPEETRPSASETRNRVQKRRSTCCRRQSIKVENVVIDIADKSSTDESSDSGTEELIDLNSTYSAKTMGRRRLSHMLDVLKEIDGGSEASMPPLHVNGAKDPSCKNLPLPEYLSPFTPSPRTPCNSVKPIFDRSFRLGNISNLEQTPRSQKNTILKKRHY